MWWMPTWWGPLTVCDGWNREVNLMVKLWYKVCFWWRQGFCQRKSLSNSFNSLWTKPKKNSSCFCWNNSTSSYCTLQQLDLNRNKVGDSIYFIRKWRHYHPRVSGSRVGLYPSLVLPNAMRTSWINTPVLSFKSLMTLPQKAAQLQPTSDMLLRLPRGTTAWYRQKDSNHQLAQQLTTWVLLHWN